jgi:hypothetical protein
MKSVAEGVWIGAVVVSCTGCFTYRATELHDLAEGAAVRVELTRQGLAALTDLPMQSSLRVSGKLVSSTDDLLRVRVPVAVEHGSPTLAQEFVIPARDVVQFESRELSRVRTGVAVASGIGVVVALYLGFEKGNPFSDDKPEDPEVEGPGFRASPRRSQVRFSIPIR